jgi:hypothetical protein
MNNPMTDTTPVPSREAVEAMIYAKGLDHGEGEAMYMVLNLLAEVERLTNELAFERRDRAMADAAAESLRAEVERLTPIEERLIQVLRGGEIMLAELDTLRATVAEQGAALDRLRDELSNIATVDPMGWIDFERGDRLNQFRQWAQKRARHALASAQSG